MQDLVTVTGLVLYEASVSDYDRRIKILTKERGKITVFARGARRPNSKFLAATNPFSFGTFKLYPGKEAYNLVEAHIDNYFESMRTDFLGAMYGMYFLEIADYYARENNDDVELLKLLYQSLRAIGVEKIPNELVRYIYEIKAIVVNGEFPGVLSDKELLVDTRYTIEYIVETKIEKLYTFVVSEEVLKQLAYCAKEYRSKCIGRHFKSLEILESCNV